MKKIAPVIIIIVFLILIKNNVSSIVKTIKDQNTAENLKKQVDQEHKKNQFLTQRLYYVKTDEFIEEEARTKLGMLQENEFIVIAPTSSPPNQEIISYDDTPNWKRWIDLFF